jgi:hypothetical protein
MLPLIQNLIRPGLSDPALVSVARSIPSLCQRLRPLLPPEEPPASAVAVVAVAAAELSVDACSLLQVLKKVMATLARSKSAVVRRALLVRLCGTLDSITFILPTAAAAAPSPAGFASYPGFQLLNMLGENDSLAAAIRLLLRDTDAVVASCEHLFDSPYTAPMLISPPLLPGPDRCNVALALELLKAVMNALAEREQRQTHEIHAWLYGALLARPLLDLHIATVGAAAADSPGRCVENLRRLVDDTCKRVAPLLDRQVTALSFYEMGVIVGIDAPLLLQALLHVRA